MMKRTRMKLQGFGLIEVLLSLAVAAGLIVLGVNYYSSIRSAQKTSRLINQMNGIGRTVENYIAKHPGTDLSKVFGSGKTDVASSGALAFSPLDVQNAWAPTTRYGVFVFIGGNNSAAQGCNTIQLQVDKGLNKADCVKFQDKISAAFGNGITVSCKDQASSFSYCANKTKD